MPTTTYLAIFAYFALMLSPILVPLAVALGHHAAAGMRRVTEALRDHRSAPRQRVVWRTAEQDG